MTETSVLGIVQGVTEWLPVSSEGMIILVKVNLFRSGAEIGELIQHALFLHLGTALAVLIYFWKDFVNLFKGFINYKDADQEKKILVRFYFSATLISGVVGFLLFKLIDGIGQDISLGGKGITLLIGLMLLWTAFLQFKRKRESKKDIVDLKTKDSFLLGLVQGFSVIPGLSRSGLTVSTFLLRGFNEKQALRLSFLMSLPVILAGNIFLNSKSVFNLEAVLGFSFSFILGILTIHLLLKIADKLNFGYFVLLFSILTIASVLV